MYRYERYFALNGKNLVKAQPFSHWRPQVLLPLFLFNGFHLRSGCILVSPDVVDEVKGQLDHLEDHDDCNAGKQTKGSSQSRNETRGLKESMMPFTGVHILRKWDGVS